MLGNCLLKENLVINGFFGSVWRKIKLFLGGFMKFGKTGYRHPDYLGVPVIDFQNSDDFLKCEFRSDGVYRCLLVTGLSLDVLLKGTEYFDDKDPVLLVCFSGAIAGRDGAKAPFFSGLNIGSELKLPLLSISDCSLALDHKLSLAWYAGNDEVPNFQTFIARTIEVVANKHGARVVMFGGSGGGFACLTQACLLDVESKAFVWNPQISIADYNPQFVQEYLETSFSDFKNSKDDAYRFLEAKNILHDISVKSFKRLSSVLYIQNDSDWHVSKHMLPFVKSKKLSAMGGAGYASDDRKVLVRAMNWGQGHIAPPKNYILSGLKQLADGVDVSEVVIEGVTRSSSSQLYDDGSFEVTAWLCRETLHVYAKSAEKGCKFACYVFEGKSRKFVTWYGQASSFVYDVSDLDSSIINVMVFRLCVDGTKIAKRETARSLFGTLDKGKVNIAILGNIAIGESFKANQEEFMPGCSGGDFVQLLKRERVDKSDVCFFHLDSPCDVGSVEVSLVKNGIEFTLPWKEDRLALDVLETPEVKTFAERFTYASRRHLSPEVALYVAKRNLTLPNLRPNIFINSVVICCYKSLEIFALQSDFNFLLRSISRALTKIEQLSEGAGARNDPLQLFLSLSMAKCHCLLATKAYDELLSDAGRVESKFRGANFYGYYSVNLAKVYFFGLAAADLLGLPERANELMDLIDKVKIDMEDFIESGSTGWLSSERVYVDELLGCVKKIRAARDESIRRTLIVAGAKAASRVRADTYMDLIDGIYL